MVNAPRPDDGVVNPEPDVEGHLVGLPGIPGVNPDEDVEGHSLTRGDRPIDR
jgi:hypothetical protein